VSDPYLATGLLLLNVVKGKPGLVSRDCSPVQVVELCSEVCVYSWLFCLHSSLRMSAKWIPVVDDDAKRCSRSLNGCR